MKFKELIEELNHKGKNNPNYKGPGKRNVRADHLEAEKKKKSSCEKCGSSNNLEMAESPPGSKKYRTLCKSCHTKYDEKHKNFKGK